MATARQDFNFTGVLCDGYNLTRVPSIIYRDVRWVVVPSYYNLETCDDRTRDDRIGDGKPEDRKTRKTEKRNPTRRPRKTAHASFTQKPVLLQRPFFPILQPQLPPIRRPPLLHGPEPAPFVSL